MKPRETSLLAWCRLQGSGFDVRCLGLSAGTTRMTRERTCFPPSEGLARGLGSRVRGEGVVGGRGWQACKHFFSLMNNLRVLGLWHGVEG